MATITVFCGSSMGKRPIYQDAARSMGGLIAGGGHRLIYGAGNCGLMGTVADAALTAGGEVVGVIPDHLDAWNLTHRQLTSLHLVDSMHARKTLMAAQADLFIALPGGFGTLDELCEILTWAQLNLHDKPIGLLEVDNYWRPFIQFLDHAVAEGFLRAVDRERLIISEEPAALLERCVALVKQ